MCVSVARASSVCLVPHPAVLSAALSPGGAVVVGGGGRLAGRPAMAPALTQAPTPHQRCCPAPSPTSSSSTNLTGTLLPPKAKGNTAEELPDDLVAWPSPQCCGGGGGVKNNGRGGGGSGGNRSAKHQQKTSTSTNKSGREIARSDEVNKSRGPASSSSRALDRPHPQEIRIHQQPPASSAPKSPSAGGQEELALAAAVAPPRPLTNGGGGDGDGDGRTSTGGAPALNGGESSGTKTMGLQPTAPGDRMDIDSPPLQPPAPRTADWTGSSSAAATTLPGHEDDDPHCLLIMPASVSEDGAMQVDEPSVEDVILDVIKSMEAGGGGAGDHQAACLGLSEAEQELLRDAVASLPDSADVATPLPTTRTAAAAAVPVEDKAAEVERRLAEARAKQQVIESRCQTLLRRAGRLQSRHVGRHVADQVSHFVSYARETLSLGTQGRHSGSNGANLYGWAEDGRLPTREEVRNIPTATLVNLVSRLQAPPVSYLSNRRYFGLPSRSTSSSASSSSTTSQQQQQQQQQQVGQSARQQLSSQVAETLQEVAGLWEAQLRYLQRCDDPDATESSSGGESDDDTPWSAADGSAEAAGATNGEGSGAPLPVKPVPTYQRAAWRWARDRAAVAARWSWLQAQVSDLEYRIRQHTDVYRQLRAAKGPVHFASPPPNGLLSTAASSSSPNGSPVKDEDAEAGCSLSSSRTRPLVTSSGSGFRHRRLIKASQHGAGSARRPSRGAHGSTVRCCCVMSRIYHPCVLCNGKNNYLLPVDPDGMTLGERIGLTDRGFHPVLSLPQDAPLGAHVDSLLKSGDWRPPPPPSAPAPSVSKPLRRSSSKPGEDADGGPGGGSAKRRQPGNNKRKKSEMSLEESKAERRKALLKRRKRAALSSDALDEDSASFPSSPFGDGGGSVPTTPGRPGGHRNSVFHDMMRRRTSYDIDNIVIPYSMAATTRVERLQYKEIQTPKWRILAELDEEGAAVAAEDSADDEEEEDVEDVGEEACMARHERSEAEERRKFMSYLKQPAGLTRGRRRVDHLVTATDHRADQSSGANTPDQPMSPAPPADASVAGSKMMADDLAECGGGPLDGGGEADVTSYSASAAIKERRRTASLTKKDAPWKFPGDDNSAMSWADVDEIRTVAPYEPRVFPLPDNVFQQLLEEMPPDEAEEEQPHRSSVVSKTEGTSAGASGGASAAGVYDLQSRPATPVTFISESVDSLSPAEDAEDLDVDEVEDPNDPEWEGSQGSAPPRSRKR